MNGINTAKMTGSQKVASSILASSTNLIGAFAAGLTTRRLTLREIFPSAMVLWISEKSHVRTIDFSVIVDETPMPLVA
jgi:hypothetical protein